MDIPEKVETVHRTVVVIDMVDYSTIARLLEENTGSDVVAQLNRQIQEFIAGALAVVSSQQDCSVLATTGDGAIVLFESCDQAHRFGEALHRRTSEYNKTKTEDSAKRWFRVGIATGELSRHHTDNGRAEYAGITIANAVRLETGARPGEIVVDTQTYESLSDELRAVYGQQDVVHGKRLEKFPARRYQVITGAPVPRIESPSRRRSRLQIGWAVLGVIVLVVSAGLVLRERIEQMMHPVPKQKHIAVMPFRNLGNNPADQAFCEGLVETVTGKLSQLERYQESFWVVPASDARAAKSFDDAYRNLNVTLVVTGSMQRVSDHITVITFLVDPKTHRQLDSKRLSTSAAELAALPDRLWEAVADMLELQIDPKIASEVASGGTRVPGAYDYYEQGLGYVRRYSIEDLDAAIGLFEKAIDRDDRYALAYAGLGEAYSRKYELTKDPQWLEQAKNNGRIALQLNGYLAPVRLTIGQNYMRTGQYEEAIREFRKALAIDPGAFDVYFYLGRIYESQGQLRDAEENFETFVKRRPGYWLGYSGLGWFFSRHGNFERAAESFRIMIDLQPDNPMGYENLGGALLAMSRFQEAVTILENSIKLKPSPVAFSNLGSAYMYLGNYDAAALAMERAVKLSPHDFDLWRNLADSYRKSPNRAQMASSAYHHALDLALERLKVNSGDAYALASVGLFHARLGNPSSAESFIAKALAAAPQSGEVLFTSALVYESIGRRARCLRAIDAAWKAGYPLALIESEPELKNVSNDPNFAQWAVRAKLQSKSH
jgi:tetratricopeptide (TPR) repeat protein/class 3 adenylate cyclase